MLLPMRRLAVAPLLCLLAIAGCHGKRPATEPSRPAATQSALNRYEYAQVRMGILMRLVVWAPDEQTAENAARAAYTRVTQIDDIASDYRTDSELARLCAQAGKGPVKVSPELFLLIKKSIEFSKLSDGGFDITCGPVVRLWRTARKVKKLPPPEEIAKALELVGYKKIHLDEARQTVALEKPGMELDLGGIAKGYAGDQAIATLRNHGIRAALFECGGDIVVSDAPPDQPAGWMISVVSTSRRRDWQKVLLHNCAISTSGDTEQFVIIDGKRYSHVVDPRTGYGLSGRMMCTVIAADGLDSDPLAKVIVFLGPDGAERVAQAYPKVKYYLRAAEE